MNKEMHNRLDRLERSAHVDLPPVLHIDGRTSPPRLWNKGVTRSEAEAVNASMAELRQLLDSPAPNEHMEDY